MSKIKTLLNIIRTKIICLNKHISLGKKARVSKTCLFNVDSKSNIQIGDFFETRNNCELRAFEGGVISIGHNCFLNNNVNIVAKKSILIGNNVQIGHNTLIIDHDHDFKNNFSNFNSSEITIGNNVWIGAGTIILRGAIIGDNCVIGAGSIVKGEIPQGTLFFNKREPFSKEIV